MTAVFGGAIRLRAITILCGVLTLDDNEVQVATLYGRIIIACLAILVAFWQLDVPVPVIP